MSAVSASQRLQITLEFPRLAAFRFGSFGSGITLFASEKALGVVSVFWNSILPVVDTARRRHQRATTLGESYAAGLPGHLVSLRHARGRPRMKRPSGCACLPGSIGRSITETP